MNTCSNVPVMAAITIPSWMPLKTFPSPADDMRRTCTGGGWRRSRCTGGSKDAGWLLRPSWAALACQSHLYWWAPQRQLLDFFCVLYENKQANYSVKLVWSISKFPSPSPDVCASARLSRRPPHHGETLDHLPGGGRAAGGSEDCLAFWESPKAGVRLPAGEGDSGCWNRCWWGRRWKKVKKWSLANKAYGWK